MQKRWDISNPLQTSIKLDSTNCNHANITEPLSKDPPLHPIVHKACTSYKRRASLAPLQPARRASCVFRFNPIVASRKRGYGIKPPSASFTSDPLSPPALSGVALQRNFYSLWQNGARAHRNTRVHVSSFSARVERLGTSADFLLPGRPFEADYFLTFVVVFPLGWCSSGRISYIAVRREWLFLSLSRRCLIKWSLQERLIAWFEVVKSFRESEREISGCLIRNVSWSFGWLFCNMFLEVTALKVTAEE